MKKLIVSKKGFDAFTLLLTIMAIMVLGIILIAVIVKQDKVATNIGSVGGRAGFILSNYDEADKALLYLDYAAKLSMQKATYDLAFNGFYRPGTTSCGFSGSYNLWTNGSAEKADDNHCEARLTQCTPSGTFFEDNFKTVFRNELNSHISSYNVDSSVKLLENNYNDVRLGKLSDGLEVVGKAGNPLVVQKPELRYEVLPSFREHVNIDLLGDFNDIVLGESGGRNRVERLVGQPEAEIESLMQVYTAETGLRWTLENYDSGCRDELQCDLKACSEQFEETVCETNDEGERECKTINYVKQGRLKHEYCSPSAAISVKIVDPAYKTDLTAEGYRKVIAESGAKVLEYRFALNWVEMRETECILDE